MLSKQGSEQQVTASRRCVEQAPVKCLAQIRPLASRFPGPRPGRGRGGTAKGTANGEERITGNDRKDALSEQVGCARGAWGCCAPGPQCRSAARARPDSDTRRRQSVMVTVRGCAVCAGRPDRLAFTAQPETGRVLLICPDYGTYGHVFGTVIESLRPVAGPSLPFPCVTPLCCARSTPASRFPSSAPDRPGQPHGRQDDGARVMWRSGARGRPPRPAPRQAAVSE